MWLPCHVQFVSITQIGLLAGQPLGVHYRGRSSKKFIPVPLEATTGIILAMVNGLLRRRSLKIDDIQGLKEATVAFCRRLLLSF